MSIYYTMKSTYARIALQHINETNPDLIRRLYKNDLNLLKEIINQKVQRALEMDKYYASIDLDYWQQQEMINNYLAPPEEIPTETQKELSELTIIKILKKMGYEAF